MVRVQVRVEFASDPRYALDSGGYDVQLRLADARAAEPEGLALDPDALMAQGNQASDRAVRMMSTTLPVGLAFLLGALGQAIRGPRRSLLALGWTSLLVAAFLALALELLA